jgi:hypothetical protein
MNETYSYILYIVLYICVSVDYLGITQIVRIPRLYYRGRQTVICPNASNDTYHNCDYYMNG